MMIFHGANLIPEGLETGEYKVGGTAEIDDLEPVYIVAYAVDTFGNKLNGIFSGIQFLAYSDVDLLKAFLVNVQMEGSSENSGIDKILTIFTVPKLAFNGVTIPNNAIEDDIQAEPRTVTLNSTPDNLDGYIPKNGKVRTYPYCYIGFNPNGGSSKIFRYEDFENGIPKFNFISEINPHPQVAVIPQNYRGSIGNSLADICNISGYPTISWSVDVYNVWLAQNSNFINLKMENLRENAGFDQARNIGGVASSLGTALNKDIGGAISQAGNSLLDYEQYNLNYEYQIKEQTAQMEYQQKLPNTGNFGDNNCTLLGYNLFDKNIFTRYTIKKEFAKIIDDYFSMFGYQTNELKIPNINNRPNWNYIKTIHSNIVGDIPEIDILKIKSMFDNGITLWHNPETFLDYSQNNK